MRAFPLGTALAFLGGSAVYLIQGAALPLGTAAQPGPGLFPRLVGLLLLISSLAFLVRCYRGGAESAAMPRGADGRRVAGVTAALGAFCLFLPWLGYLLMASALLLAVLRLFGLRHWGASAVLTVAGALGSYYLFAVVLGVPLPAGLWGR